MELTEYLGVLRKRWITVALLTVAGVAVGALFSLVATPTYQSTTRMFLSMELGDSLGEAQRGTNFTRDQMASYAEVAASPLVLSPVIEDLELDISPQALSEQVAVTIPNDTTILEITVSHANPQAAADIANSIGDQLTEAVDELSPGSPGTEQAVRATVLSPASPAADPSSPNAGLNIGLGLALGLLLGTGVAVLRETLDTKIRVDRDIAQVTDTPVIGNIVFEDDGISHPVFMHADARGFRAEAIRRLRTNLQFVDLIDRPNSIVITSSVPGEGKTTTAINLAISLADAGARVLLVDADLRKPSVGEYLGLESRAGLTTVLIGRAKLDEVVQQTRSAGLHVLPSGQIPPNPSELLGSKAMSNLLTRSAREYDLVIIDSPPLLPVTDAAVLSKLTGGALVIAGADRIHRAQLSESMAALEHVDAHVLGVVLNKVERRERSKYYYRYGTYDDTETKSQSSPLATTARTPDASTTPARGTAPAGDPAVLGTENGEPRRTTWPGTPLASLNDRRRGVN